jgi:predicted NBD/HSP70 family sugar kinase
MLMDRTSLQKSFEDLGDLEDRVGAISVTRAARQRGLNVPAGTLLTAQDIVAMSDDGNAVAERMAEELLDLVAIAIANMSVLLDPELIVIGTNRTPVSDTVVDGIAARLKGRIIRVPSLVRAELGENAVLMGVAELALDQVSGLTYVAQ